MKKQHELGEIICNTHFSDKYKELLKLNNKQTNNLIKNTQNLNKHIPIAHENMLINVIRIN